MVREPAKLGLPNMRQIVVWVLLVATVTACGSSEEQTEPSEDSMRVLDTAMGPVRVAESPRRVVVLDSGELDEVLSLGVKPVGIVTATGVEDVQPYLADQVDGVPRVGTNTEPELEKIAELEPDLIIGTKVRVEKSYDLLSGIAPTVLGESPADWKENLLLHGDALGRKQQAESLLSDFEARAAELGDRLGEGDRPSVAVVRFVPGEIRLYAPESFVGSILVEDVGVRLPPAAEEVTGDINATLSLENLDEADADVLYTSTYGAPDATDEAQATGLPMWQRLTAVESGRVHQVDDDIWMLGIGVTGAGLVLDDLEETLPAG